MKIAILLAFLFFIFTGCKSSGGTADEAFGVKLTPDVNINLMSVNPANKTLFINESAQFTASGGKSPYVYSIDSGVGTIDENGLYTAPSVAGSAVIKAVDSENEEAFATVSIAIQISISPTSATIGEGDTLHLTGAGGIPPYTYRIVAGNGSINTSTGLYDSTGVSSGSAVIEVKDSSNNTAYSAVTINPSLVISPASQTIGYGQQISFSTSGGDIPYTYSVLTGGGSINSSTGVYTAPSVNGSAIVRVTDSSNNSVDAVVSIIDSPQISRPKAQIGINRTMTFSASNGSPPYAYSIVSGGGSIVAATGVFTAPATAGTTVIKVADANNYSDTTSIVTFIPKQISAGAGHTCIIDYTNPTTSIAKCWGGYNGTYFGHLGPEPSFYLADDATNELGDNLRTVDLGTNVQAIGVKAGRYTTCAVTSDYRLKCFGYNNYGNLGLGDRVHRGYLANQMGNNLPYVDLGTGRTINNSIAIENALSVYHHSVCAILDNNSTRCFGYGGGGKLGNASTTNLSDAANEVGDGIAALDFGADYAVQISVGVDHTCAVLQDGNVKCWGEAGYGKLGYENQTDQVKKPKDVAVVDLGTGRTAQKVSVGWYHTCVLLDNGDVKCFGRSNYGQLGQGDTNSLGDNASEMGDNLPKVDLGTGKTATDIEATLYSTCALLNDGSVKCWGYNTYGELGEGSTNNRGDGAGEMGDVLVPVDLGSGRTAMKLYGGTNQMCAKLDTSVFKCWGRNNNAQLAQGHKYDIGKSALSLGDNLAAINLSSSASIVTMQTNEYVGCAVLSDGKLKCWGRDYNGSRGTGDSSIGDETSDMGANLLSLTTGSNAPFKEIQSHMYVTCALNTDNKLSCFGYGNEGGRASGSVASYGFIPDHWADNLSFVDFGSGRTVKDFDVGYRGGCAILDNDTVACWGSNAYGQCGVGSNTARGDAANEIGSNFVFSDMGSVSTPVQITRGYYHSCARFANGKVKCWGYNATGQLGLEHTNNIGDGANEMGDNLSFIDLGSGIKSTSVCAGNDFTCSLFDNGKIKCWGQKSRIGLNAADHKGDAGGEMGDALSFLDLGTGRTATQLACGVYHACAILDNDSMKCWGNNNYGGLGQGSTNNIGDGPAEMGDNLPPIKVGTDLNVVSMGLGQYHTCAVLDDNSVKCFGYNNFGQLGLGHLTNMGTLDVTMGDSLPKVDTE